MSKIDHAKRNEVGILQRELRQVNTYSGAGDSSHPGAGFNSVQLGPGAEAALNNGVAVGSSAKALNYDTTAVGGGTYVDAEYGTALGHQATVNSGHDRSSAIGWAAETTAADQLVLGHGPSFPTTVTVPGRFNVRQFTPSGSADSQGTVGDITTDDDYVYWKTSGGWLRAAGSTF